MRIDIAGALVHSLRRYLELYFMLHGDMNNQPPQVNIYTSFKRSPVILTHDKIYEYIAVYI